MNGKKMKILRKKEAEGGKVFWKEVGTAMLYNNDDGTVSGSLYLHLLDCEYRIVEDRPYEDRRNRNAERERA